MELVIKMDNSTQQQSMVGPSADNPKSSKSMEFLTSVEAGLQNSPAIQHEQRNKNVNDAIRRNFVSFQSNGTTSSRSWMVRNKNVNFVSFQSNGSTSSRSFQGNVRSITNQNQNKGRELRLPQRLTNQKASSKPKINLDGMSNLSWRQRPAPMSQTLQQSGNDRYGNSGHNDMVGRHRNSFGASQSNGKAIPNIHQKQQFRNSGASDQSVRINSTSFSNRGQFNRNRNQLSENNERSKGQSFENGNFHRHRTENHPT